MVKTLEQRIRDKIKKKYAWAGMYKYDKTVWVEQQIEKETAFMLEMITVPLVSFYNDNRLETIATYLRQYAEQFGITLREVAYDIPKFIDEDCGYLTINNRLKIINLMVYTHMLVTAYNEAGLTPGIDRWFKELISKEILRRNNNEHT